MNTLHRIGHSPVTRWIRNIKHHLADGGMVYVETDTVLSARVAGDAGVPHPRTTELGDVLTVRSTPLAGASGTPHVAG